MITKTLRDHPIILPPTKESLAKLFTNLNLLVSPVKLIDCLVFIKTAANKPENPVKKKDPNTGKTLEEEWSYDPTKLITWFHLNIRTFKHIDE